MYQQLWQFQVNIEPTDRALVVQGAQDHAGGSPLQVPEDSTQWERWLHHSSLSRARAGGWAGVRASVRARARAGGLSHSGCSVVKEIKCHLKTIANNITTPPDQVGTWSLVERGANYGYMLYVYKLLCVCNVWTDYSESYTGDCNWSAVRDSERPPSIFTFQLLRLTRQLLVSATTDRPAAELEQSWSRAWCGVEIRNPSPAGPWPPGRGHLAREARCQPKIHTGQ